MPVPERMLSRIAESLFWIARYMERAEDTARILDVNYHMLLEQSQQTYRLRWDPLVEHLRRTGALLQALLAKRDAQTVFEFLGFHEENPNSIAQCIFQRARKRPHHSRPHLPRNVGGHQQPVSHGQPLPRRGRSRRRPAPFLRAPSSSAATAFTASATPRFRMTKAGNSCSSAARWNAPK